MTTTGTARTTAGKAAAAVALYHRTRAQYLHLTRQTLIPADHNNLPRPLTLAFPLHRSEPRPAKPRRRPLTRALHHLLAAAFPPLPAPAPSAPAPPPTHLTPRPCRFCEATNPSDAPGHRR
ncbi:hypothetical protein SAMN04488000_13515 [Lentzea albida]|uniref:Uncharacterized protein n=1 Tax=Lentzea albida TaxID=65499 RepID=A0A1H9XG37_9PSEU|nr:hypothetical protein SAMN04488000_13515 [Lentzea albida]